MTITAAAETLVARAAALGRYGKTIDRDAVRKLAADLCILPVWLADLLLSVPLCGLEVGWQAYEPEQEFDGVMWLEWSDAGGIRSESLDCYPGLAILSAGYVNVAGCTGCTGGTGDPYFICVHEGVDPPLYQVYHHVSSETKTILAEGRRVVSPRLSEFFQLALLPR